LTTENISIIIKSQSKSMCILLLQYSVSKRGVVAERIHHVMIHTLHPAVNS